MFKGFKDFLLRGNVVDLAVAVVIGAAFTAVVTSFTKSFLEPLLRLFSGGEDAIPPGTIPLTNEVQLDYASFLNAIVTFFITAAVIYFLVVFPMKWLQERRRRGEEDGPAESTDVELLKEIRDLLLAQEERAERLDALGVGAGVGARAGAGAGAADGAARTTHLPPQPPNGYEPYADSPYPEPTRRQEPPRRHEPAQYQETAQYQDATRPQPRPSAVAVDGVQPPPRRRRHADPRG